MGQQAEKNRGIFQVKSRTTNIQNLKVVDPETMDGWSYHRLCEIFGGPFGLAPGGQFRSNFSNWPKMHQQFSRPS